MPWTTPTLRDVRSMVRDAIRAQLPGADASVPNSVLRVVSDAQGGLCHLTLQYIDWLALQLLPDTAETEWLDRHGDIWLTNADGTTGRKLATPAVGTATFTATVSGGVIIPASTRLTGLGQEFETLTQITADLAPSPADIRALDPGTPGNIPSGTVLTIVAPIITNIDQTATVTIMGGGTDEETDDELRMRVLERIRQPPMGGDAEDYVAWALAVPGVTRAWAYPNEMGMGTVTVRFMCDDLRESIEGFPLQSDVDAVRTYIDSVRPVTVKDFWCLAPLRQELEFTIHGLVTDTESIRAGIEQSVQAMLLDRAKPGQTIYRSWIEMAIAPAPGVDHYNLDFEDLPMPSNGYMPVLGSIVYA